MLDRSVVRPRGVVDKRLNIVGEDHEESRNRRVLERQFSAATTLSANYWQEVEFLDLHQPVSGRKPRVGQAGSAGADLMEFRAVHGATLLLGAYEKMTKTAQEVVSNPTGAAVQSFIDVQIPAFVALRDNINRRWRPSETDAVNQAVQVVYDTAQRVCQTYLNGINGATAAKKLANTRILADNATILRSLVPAMAKAVGFSVPPDNDAAVLAQNMRTERSKFMGLAAGLSKETGVWKVGELHIVDLLSGALKIDTSRINIVTQDTFNTELKAWQARPAK
jgi:hypothetical protein